MNSKYIDKTHTYGRVWIFVTLALFLCIPALICYHLDVFPKAEMVFKGLATVAVVFYPTAVLEVLTYSPLLGTGGTYLGFVTGNITNLKLPVALNAMESAEVEPNTEKGEVISTISIAVSSIVTTVIIAVCVLAFRPVLHNITDKDSVFAPAFQQVTPALFGALCVISCKALENIHFADTVARCRFAVQRKIGNRRSHSNRRRYFAFGRTYYV